MNTAQMVDSNSIKLHTDHRGIVWFADGEKVPISSELNAVDFADSLRRKQQLKLRMIGNHANAPLIMRLRSVVEGSDGSIEVISPLVCRSIRERIRPEIVLFRLRQCQLPASLGGWHKMSPVDYATFSLVAQLQQDQQYLPTTRHLLLRHPVWRALSFVGGLHEEWAAWLLHTVIDPRWFVDLQNPGRLAKLRAFLGLDPVNQQLAMTSREADPCVAVRCRIVYGAWASFIPTEPPPPDEAPRQFLWRVYFQHGGGTLGALRASQRFVAFLAYAWLEAIRAANTHGPRCSLFLPEMLLKHPEEIAAFRQHIGGDVSRI